MIIPMIDIMFFLLVFFMLGTMYMVELKTLPIKLPVAANYQIDRQTLLSVTLKNDGSLWIEDKSIDLASLLVQLTREKKVNPNCSVIVRADRSIDYGKVVKLLDNIKASGITKIGLATEKG